MRRKGVLLYYLIASLLTGCVIMLHNGFFLLQNRISNSSLRFFSTSEKDRVKTIDLPKLGNCVENSVYREHNVSEDMYPRQILEYKIASTEAKPNCVLHQIKTLPRLSLQTVSHSPSVSPVIVTETPSTVTPSTELVSEDAIERVKKSNETDNSEEAIYKKRITNDDNDKEINVSYERSEPTSIMKNINSSLSKSRSNYKYRFGSRFSRSFHRNDYQLSNSGSSFFPPDHVPAEALATITSRIAKEERIVLNKMKKSMRQQLLFYKTQTAILNDDNKSKMEKTSFDSLTADWLEQYNKMVAWTPNMITCDGCKVKEEYRLRRSTKEVNNLVLRKFVGNVEMKTIYNNENFVYPNERDLFSVTAICVTTKTRLFFIKQLLYRWKGPMCIVLNGHSNEEREIMDFIRSTFLPSRITLILYLMGRSHRDSGSFPVNKLRNLAIRNIQTTHFMIFDMDLWPTLNTYDEFTTLPASIRNNNKSAIILPTFFFKKGDILNRCHSFKQCILLGLQLFPNNITSLKSCIISRLCETRKPYVRTHTYVMPEWFESSSSSHVSQINCFVTDFQEPYVMLKYTSETPLFDEHFKNYGYNKVQLVEHLRAAAYNFYILKQAFAMDMPHKDSEYRKSYLLSLHGQTQPMRNVYANFQARLNSKYEGAKRFKICSNLKSEYYITIH